MLDNFRVILVSPSGPANVGAVARIMANMGMRDLVVVAPRCDLNDEQARAYSAHGRDVLESVRVVDEIPAALDGCLRTYVTSSKLGMYRRQVAIPPEDAAAEAAGIARDGRVAFAFGREDYGLKTPELLHFDRVVSIPADEDYPVLNLAAAATVMCYLIRRAVLAAAQAPALPKARHSGWADENRKQQLFRHLFDGLERIGFFFGQSPDHLKYSLRHALGRLDLTINEADILIGMARQIQWYAENHPRKKP